MITSLPIFRILLFTTAFCHGQQRLEVTLDPLFASQPLSFDTLALETGAKQRVSVTRCDLLVSGAALQREDGTWLGASTWAAFISARAGRNAFTLANIPAGKFSRLKFQIGLAPAVNRVDPARYPADHPLNPTVNGMHWGWQGGYVFAALEGRWRTREGGVGGYSFHLANEGNVATVELPMTLDLTEDRTLRLAFHVDRIFNSMVITSENAATHSRSGDPLATWLRDGFSRAFEVTSITSTPTRIEAAAAVKALIAPEAAPYPLTFPASFPRPSLPTDNPLTHEGVALGERLFHDPGLSGNGTQSCSTCHDRRDAFSDRRRFSIGAFGDKGTRQSMPLYNLAWKSGFFWDGRTASLRQQVLEPVENPFEMHAKLPAVVDYISASPRYQEMFADAFGAGKIDADRISRALEQFLLTLVSWDSKFDRALRGQAVLTPEEQRGAELFNTEYDPARGSRGADCFHCHGGPLFRSAAFANNGLDGAGPDPGRFKATKAAGDRGKFAVPSLRNIALTAPYMHDGRFRTLEEVVAHYDGGLQSSPTLDPNLAKHPVTGLQLGAENRRAIVAFLNTLTDHKFIQPEDPKTGN
ncbi:MAG: MbnP family protein [Verrucomicrobiota bacterium]